MILTRHYDLDIIPGGQPLIIRVSKNDTSSVLVFSLFTGIGSLAIPAQAAASFRGRGTDEAAAFSQGAVTVSLTKAMTQAVGLIPFEIVLSSGAYRLVTATLYLDVRG